MRRTAMLIVAALLLMPAAGRAQGFGAALSGGYVIPSGDGYEGIDGGIGLDGRLFYKLPGGLELGAGVARASMTESETGLNIDYSRLEFYGEPRWNIPTLGMLDPFVGVRAGWSRESLDVDADNHANGWTLGGIAGLSYKLGQVIAFELAGVVNHLSFSDFEMDGEQQPGSEHSGQAYGVRLGLSFTLPGGGVASSRAR